VTNLKRIIVACGDRRVIIITPGPRYLTQPCCCDGSHCVHLLIPDASLKMMADLARLHQFIQRRLSSSANCLVIPACDLLVGKKGASLEEALAAFSSWGTVHGPNASYTRMALALVDSYFGKTTPAAPVTPKTATQQLKRQRAESESGSESGQPCRASTVEFQNVQPPAQSARFHEGRIPRIRTRIREPLPARLQEGQLRRRPRTRQPREVSCSPP
jgi:hypothetical protein